MVLTPEEKEMLKQINEDKFAVGAFNGMIFNALVKITEGNRADKIDRIRLIETLIKDALTVRIFSKKLSS